MSHLSWTIGQVTIHQLIEIEDTDQFSSFIPKAKPKHIREIAWLYPHFADGKGNLKALVQSFLIQSNGKNILIDTCNGNDKSRPTVPSWGNLHTPFLDKLTELNLQPSDIDLVACTHLHFDHIGWNTQLKNGDWVPTFPQARYIFSQQEYDYWKTEPKKEMIDDLNGIEDSIAPIILAGLAEFVGDEYQIDQHIKFIPTPGHTPHHVSVVIESDGEKAIISGDVLHHPCQIAHPDWATSADTYPDQAVTTRKKILADIKDTRTLLIGSHFPNPVAGRVVTSGTGLILKIPKK